MNSGCLTFGPSVRFSSPVPDRRKHQQSAIQLGFGRQLTPQYRFCYGLFNERMLTHPPHIARTLGSGRSSSGTTTERERQSGSAATVRERKDTLGELL